MPDHRSLGPILSGLRHTKPLMGVSFTDTGNTQVQIILTKFGFQHIKIIVAIGFLAIGNPSRLPIPKPSGFLAILGPEENGSQDTGNNTKDLHTGVNIFWNGDLFLTCCFDWLSLVKSYHTEMLPSDLQAHFFTAFAPSVPRKMFSGASELPFHPYHYMHTLRPLVLF